jgi:hypothetical protein
MTFDELKRSSFNDILDRKKISLEERYELNGLMNKIETVEHLKEFVDGLDRMFADKPVHLRSSNANKVSRDFEASMKEYLQSVGDEHAI